MFYVFLWDLDKFYCCHLFLVFFPLFHLVCFYWLSISLAKLSFRTTAPCLVPDRGWRSLRMLGEEAFTRSSVQKWTCPSSILNHTPKEPQKVLQSLIIHRHMLYNVLWMRMNQQVQRNWIKKWTATQTKHVRGSR